MFVVNLTEIISKVNIAKFVSYNYSPSLIQL